MKAATWALPEGLTPHFASLPEAQPRSPTRGGPILKAGQVLQISRAPAGRAGRGGAPGSPGSTAKMPAQG